MSVAGGGCGLSVRSVDVSLARRTGRPRRATVQCDGGAAMRRRTISIAEPQQRHCNLGRVAKIDVLLCLHCQAGRLHVVQVLMGQAGSACHAQIPARIGQRWAIICGNGVGLEKHSPYASTTGQLGRVVQSNTVHPPQEVFLISTGLASRRINAIRYRESPSPL